MTKMTAPTSIRALWAVLGGGVVAWLVFLAAIFSDVAIEAGRSVDELWGPDATVVVRPSLYLFFIAIAVFTLGGVWGHRLASRQLHAQPSDRLARGVRRFAVTVVIIGLVLAAWAAITVFMANFFDSAANDAVYERVLNSYLPIVLYTALVIAVILIAFVFTRASVPEIPPAEAPLAERSHETTEHPQPEREPEPQQQQQQLQPKQRLIALGYALPIIAVAVALIFGLIVYDLTHTPLEAWIWVIVQLCVAAGIIAGTISAARALTMVKPAAGPAVGAQNLNLVLSIIFAAAVTIMSLSYGAGALQQLRVQPWLSLSATFEGPMGPEDETVLAAEDVTVNANGSGLARGSEVTVTLEPSGETLVTTQADRSGYFSIWQPLSPLPADIADGAAELTLTAVTVDGASQSVAFAVGVTEDGELILPIDAYAGSDDEPSRLVAPSVSWLVGDLLPAVVLMGLVVVTLRVTLVSRNRHPADPAA